ncbi:MAG: carbon-nitrogen family hydrolase [Eubacterium sp.]|nr:carbon-nitrogen family hydrolase [Eubacterium sp.]
MIKAGLAQMDISWENVNDNKQRAEAFFEEAAGKNVDILVFPEMSLTGFSMDVEKITGDWEDQRDFFSQMSEKYSMAVAGGYAAKRESGKSIHANRPKFENHLTIFDRGDRILDYIKIHPFSYGREAEFFTGGDRIVTAGWKDTAVGGFVCYDLRFPEVFQISSVESEVIFVIANWPRSRISHWDILLQARAIENQCFVVGVNRTGSGGGLGYNGHSAVYSPRGDRLTELSEKELLITAALDEDELREYRRKFPVKRDRRIELYKHFL